MSHFTRGLKGGLLGNAEQKKNIPSDAISSVGKAMKMQD